MLENESGAERELADERERKHKEATDADESKWREDREERYRTEL